MKTGYTNYGALSRTPPSLLADESQNHNQTSLTGKSRLIGKSSGKLLENLPNSYGRHLMTVHGRSDNSSLPTKEVPSSSFISNTMSATRRSIISSPTHIFLRKNVQLPAY